MLQLKRDVQRTYSRQLERLTSERSSRTGVNPVDGNDVNSDLNKYCQAIVEMIAEHVPDVRSYIEDLAE